MWIAPAFSAAALFMLSTTALQQRTLKTIDGPETATIGATVTGYLLMDRPVGGIVAYELPTCREITVFPERQSAVQCVAGPDLRGRIVYLQKGPDDVTRLKTASIDGTGNTEVVAYKERVWGVFGNQLALAPKGGLAAVLARPAGKQMHDPKAYLMEGSLEVWDIEKKRLARTLPNVLEKGFSWTPDGNALLLVRMVGTSELKDWSPGPDAFGSGFKNWKEVPALYSLDVERGTLRFVCVGWYPVVTEDGKSVLVSDWDGRWVRGRLEDGASEAISWPGNWRGPIAVLSDDTIIYWGLPTTGAEPRYTKHNSPLAGPKPEGTIKIGEVNGARFRTLIDYVDPRRRISFGRTAKE